jgi:pyruvate/2-oxoglutarate dehydrogenase complex dihydrolipoamide acyltransferase (E2) component
MVVRIELPRISAAIDAGTIVAWHKEVSDNIEYGDDLCDVAVHEVTRLRRRLKATASLKDGSRRRDKYRKRTNVLIRYRVVALDGGTLLTIDSPEGSTVKEGALIATMRSAGTNLRVEPDPATASSAARVLVKRIESEPEET